MFVKNKLFHIKKHLKICILGVLLVKVEKLWVIQIIHTFALET